MEAERIRYAVRLPANRVLQERAGYLLKRPVGRPPNEVRRSYANFIGDKTPQIIVVILSAFMSL
jgi:hypothetical protein